MRRGVVAFSVLALIGLGITGCGLHRYEQREPWRLQAEQACLSQKLVQPTAYMALSSEIDGPGACGMNYPFKVAALADGTVGLTTRAMLACPIIPRADGWLSEIVQPAASLYFGSPVIEMKSGSYACRGRNNQRGARLSEHAFGNALDIMAFRLADGREVSVVKGWRGTPEEQEFLREVFVGACGYFTTVLGPGADAFHYDHFHLDLARHDPRGERRVCKPMLKFTPRVGGVAGSNGPPRRTPEHQPPVEIDEEEDPFVIDSSNARTPQGVARPPVAPTYPAPPRAPVTHMQPAPPPRAMSVPPAAFMPPRAVPQAPLPPQAIAPPRREPLLLQPHVLNGHTIY
jgi:hypothetical protein